MGFLSGIKNLLDPGNISDGLSGKTAADASREAAALQAQSADKAIAFQRESRDMARGDLQPFRQAGEGRIPQLLADADSSNADAWTNGLYRIANMPYSQLNGFQDASNTMSRQVMANNAARGKLGSGNTLMDLFRENAALGESMRTNQYNLGLNTANFDESAKQNRFNRNYNLVNMGQASAAGQANSAQNTGIADLYTQQGNAFAAGGVGAANASAQGTNNMLALASLAASAFSDRRLKTGIQKVGENKGLNVYTFRYIFDPATEYTGYMADEVELLYPHAVTTIGGYQAVNYGAI